MDGYVVEVGGQGAAIGQVAVPHDAQAADGRRLPVLRRADKIHSHG
ncbi:hypothetical protein ACFCYB_11370 [Streptomyces sp. NPDC056309]